MDISCCIESIQKLLTIQGQDFYTIFLLAIKAERVNFDLISCGLKSLVEKNQRAMVPRCY